MEVVISNDSEESDSSSLRERITDANAPKYMKWRWYHPTVNGPDAERLLQERGKDGSFLVRPSRTRSGDYVLVVRQDASNVAQIRIQSQDGFMDVYGGGRFATLSEMISVYYNDEEKLEYADGKYVELKYPVAAHDTNTHERWFHANISSRDAENSLRDKGKIGNFLVRQSQSEPGNFVITVRCDSKVLHVKITSKDGRLSVEGSQDGFKSLKRLLQHYQKNHMVDKTGINIYLKSPFNTTRIKACQIEERVTLLEKLNNDDKSGFQEEYELLQAEECQLPFLREEGKKACNKVKNRYKNILPFDHTRVVLADGNPNEPGSDYINANYLESPDDISEEPKRYIATQGVNDTTIRDLYRMMWQENSSVIIMATELIENGKRKCAQYWPRCEPEIDPVTEFEIFNGRLRVELRKETDKDIYILRELGITRTQNEESSARVIYQFHFKKWPDHGVPTDPTFIINLLDDVEKKQNESPYKGPVVIHCSAGVGRTGSLIVVDMIMKSIEQMGVDREIDIFQTLKSCRAQRSGVVQTEPQYRLIYQAVQCGVKRIMDDLKKDHTAKNPDPVYENVTDARPQTNMQNGNHQKGSPIPKARPSKGKLGKKKK